ncbi:MAG: hypothetical protein K2N52_01075 [Clostridia bacterium]|nr:hypothetical protein [Clostridia bacterium]
MYIFKPDFNCVKKNAYLNWWFDHRNKDKEIQIAWDFFNMGKAYYANAITSLTMIIDANNACSIADKMIFPILFGFWHGTELLLKSGLYLVEKELNTSKPFSKNTHENFQLFCELMSRLKKLGFNDSDFKDLKDVLSEFKDKKALPTFMRYTVDEKQNEQFYAELTPDGENTCINIYKFTEKFFGIIKTLPVLIEFLGDPYFGDNLKKGELTKTNYVKYLKMVEDVDKAFEKYNKEYFAENLNLTNEMLQWIYLNLL